MHTLFSQKTKQRTSLIGIGLLILIASCLMGGLSIVMTTLLIVVILVMLFVVQLGIRQPRWLWLGLMVGLVVGQLLRIRVSESADSSIILMDLAMGLYAVVGLVGVWLRRQPFPRTLSTILLLGFCLWLPVSLLLNAYLLSHSELLIACLYSARFLLLASSFILTAWLAQAEADRRWLLRALLVSGLTLLILGIVQRILIPDIGFLTAYGWDPHKNRLLSTFIDPNFFGMFLVMLNTVFLAALLELKQIKYRSWLLLALLTTTLATVATLSRSSYLALFIATIIVLAIRSWRLVVICLISLMLLGSAIPTVRDRVIGAFQVDVTSQARVQSWVETLEIAQQQPLTGIGYNALGGARLRLGYLSSLTGHSTQGSDSSLILILTTTGVIGLLIFCGYLSALLIESYAIWRFDQSALIRTVGLSLLGIIPAYVAHSQFVNGLFYPLLFVPFALLTGVVAGRLSENK